METEKLDLQVEGHGNPPIPLSHQMLNDRIRHIDALIALLKSWGVKRPNIHHANEIFHNGLDQYLRRMKIEVADCTEGYVIIAQMKSEYGASDSMLAKGEPF